MALPFYVQREGCTSGSAVLRRVVEMGDVTLPLRGHLTMSRETFDCHDLGPATDIQWLKARDAAEHPTMPRTAPRNKELATPNTRSSKVKEPCSRCLTPSFGAQEPRSLEHCPEGHGLDWPLLGHVHLAQDIKGTKRKKLKDTSAEVRGPQQWGAGGAGVGRRVIR